MTEKVVYEAEVPRFVVQREEHGMLGASGASGWVDIEGYDTAQEAIEGADNWGLRSPAVRFRVVERG